MADIDKPLILIGPTASGKSDLALALARRVGGEILSVDSMQVYRQMDIGTAKPSRAEQTEIKHHLIDLVEPDQEYTVARFVESADAVLNQSTKPIIATGGTPLYYKALFEGMFDGPGADEAIRDRLRQLPNDELHARLNQVDPVSAARIHLNDTKRLVRALEVYEVTGKSISSFQTEWTNPVLRHEGVWIGLFWDKDALNRRINSRVKAMLASGWLEEVRKLPKLSKTAQEATGYQELLDHLAGKCTLDDAIERIKISTRQLARKQMKWLRRFGNVNWLPGDAGLELLTERAMQAWIRKPGVT